MDEIRVDTDELRSGSQSLNSSLAEFASVQTQINSTVSGIWNAYDGQLRQSVTGIIDGSIQTGSRLQNRADDLMRELLSRAVGFESANEASRNTGIGISDTFMNFMQTTPSLGFMSLFLKWKDKALALWNVAGLTAGSFAYLFSVNRKPDIVTPLPKASFDPSPNTVARGGFGDLIAKVAQENQQQEKAGQWWLDVPTQSQQGLNLNGKPTEYACTPTATSMILNYWHNKDAENKTLSAQELIDQNAKQGEFSSTGMSASDIHDEVKNLGYSVAEDHTNSNLDELKNEVANGPVIAVVKLGMRTTGTNHAVVVTGISSDSQVRINDPWDGKSKTYSWDVFSKSWGADYGQGVPKNNFIVLRP